MLAIKPYIGTAPKLARVDVAMLENLEAAAQVSAQKRVQPVVEFDGDMGTAVTPGYDAEPENFDDFLIDAGLDPKDIEVIPPVRTSRWQQQRDGELIWLTSYRFTFRRKASDINLPLLMAEAKRKAKVPTKPATTDKALVVLWSDLQVGKVDARGGTPELVCWMWLSVKSRHRLFLLTLATR